MNRSLIQERRRGGCTSSSCAWQWPIYGKELEWPEVGEEMVGPCWKCEREGSAGVGWLLSIVICSFALSLITNVL